MKNKLKVFLMVGIFLVAQSGGAGGRMELESAYLGDGWFQYRLAKPANPTYWSVDISSFGVTITNMVEYGPEPVDWTNRLDSGTHWASWDFNRAMFPQVRPYQRDFLVRSSQRNYRMARSSVAMIVPAPCTTV